MTDTMKAITYRKYGGPEVLRVESVPRPKAPKGGLLVRVRAAEATKADCELRSFKFPVVWFWLPLRLAIGVFRPRKPVLGGYFAGEIVALGDGADGHMVGDAVYGTTSLAFGAYGQFAIVPAGATVAKKPENISFEEASAVPLGGLNALHFMRCAAIQKGDRVLINGAGGSIGSYAVQIAKHMGAHVTGVDAGHKRQLVLDIGADAFVDYATDDFAADGPVFDVVFDMVAASSYSRCMSVLKPGGRYLLGNPRLGKMLRARWTTRFTDKTALFTFASETPEELKTLSDLLERGVIRAVVDGVFSMQQAPEAHRRVETEARVGAVVLRID